MLDRSETTRLAGQVSAPSEMSHVVAKREIDIQKLKAQYGEFVSYRSLFEQGFQVG